MKHRILRTLNMLSGSGDRANIEAKVEAKVEVEKLLNLSLSPLTFGSACMISSGSAPEVRNQMNLSLNFAE